jgi:uncharacterized protein YllA (UPF0747 family)
MQISWRQIPQTSALFADYLEDWTRVQQFYPRNYSIDSITQFARERAPMGASHLELLCSALSEQQEKWGGSRRGIEKLRAGAVAVVTGQQPVLFTGSHLSILKAISAIKIARRLEEAGIQAVPVFWVAAEDHDYQEIESTWILNRDSGLTRLGVDLSDDEPAPVGWRSFRDDVTTAVNECVAHLPQSEFAPEVTEILRISYQAGSSPVDAFARMMVRLFPGTELTFIDPLHPTFRKLAQPAIESAICKSAEIRQALITRGGLLTEAGYHAQVKVDENFTGFFAFRGRARQALRPHELTPDFSWSPNVLLRPAMQDTLLPTVVYIGGPAEVAYFAQAAAVYETLRRPMPPIFPRISATILEPRVARALEKYGIEFTDAFRGKEFLKRKAVEAVQDGELFDRASARIGEEIEALRPALNAVDPTLIGALETSRHKVLHQMEALRTKYVNAAAKRNETVERHLDSIANSLFPEKKLQERVINITSFLVRYGLGVVGNLEKKLGLDVGEHQVVEI